MRRSTLLTASIASIGLSLALTGCPGNEPRLDPKFLDGGAGGDTGSGGQGGCPLAPAPAVCARGAEGLSCARSDGVSGFEPASIWAPELSDAMGWAAPERYATIVYPDINGDDRADVCARASQGLLCGVNTGTALAPLTLWAPELSDAQGWSAPQSYATLRHADLDADGKDDICVRGDDGLRCALSDGSTFLPLTLWAPLPAGVAWSDPAGYTTLRLPDLNGDGRADVCVRGEDGLLCALSDGATFGPFELWSDTFRDADGWGSPAQYTTLRFPDVNGDGMADVCGRASDGVRCALSTGTTLGPASLWAAQLTDLYDWALPQYYETIRFPDVDGDGSDDLCARASDGVYCTLSDGASFGPLIRWSSMFADAAGWDVVQAYSTFSYPDLDGDGRADVCARGSAGMMCGLSDGEIFAVLPWSVDFRDAQGFDDPSSYSTLRTVMMALGACSSP